MFYGATNVLLEKTILRLPSLDEYWYDAGCHLKIFLEVPCQKSLVKQNLTNIKIKFDFELAVAYIFIIHTMASIS